MALATMDCKRLPALSRLSVRLTQRAMGRVSIRGLPRLLWITRHLLLGRGVKLVPYGRRFQICLDTESYHHVMFGYGIENRHIDRLLSRLLKAGMVVFDVGANIGMIDLLACSSLNGKGSISVHAFEPDPRAFRLLEFNVSLNRFDVTVNPWAVGALDGEAKIVISSELGWSTLANEPPGGFTFLRKERTLTTNLVALDSYCHDRSIAPALIKVDVEGFECEVLRGAEKVLLRHRPYLILEVNPTRLQAAGASTQQMESMLDLAGYRLFRVDLLRTERTELQDMWTSVPQVRPSDVQIDKAIDVICVPRERV